MSRDPIVELYERKRAELAAEHAERLKLVLGFDELAARLTKPPIGYTSPRQWSGYIPPFMIEAPTAQGRNTWTRNPSPVRVHLVAIVREAYARTYTEEIAHAWLEEINTNAWTDDWSPTDAIARAARILENSSTVKD
jgi:hypothetical protein